MKKLISIFLSVAIITFSLIPILSFADDEKTTINRFNVIFVIDASTSMKYSDAKNNRFEATDLFLGMLANDGNYVGTVVFNGNVSSKDITEVDGNSAKKSLSKSIRDSKLDSDTNIGGALLKATNLLEQKANSELPSIMILLSDGNTDFDDPKQVQESKEQKETALEIARDKGYSVYAVCLNSDGKADGKELENIAKATNGGMFEEVNNSADLKDVFDKFYTQIYGTKSSKLVDDTIGKNGKIVKEFPVSDVGVEEVNIAVFGDVDSCSIENPGGEKLSKSEMDDITFSAETFKLVKLVNPEKGKWTFTATGKPGAKVTVVKTYNVNLSVKTTVESESDSYKVNNPINIFAKIYENDQEITDLSKYSEFKGVLKVTDYDGNAVYETEVTQATDNGFEFSFTPTDLNTYYASVSVEGSEVYANAEELTFNVGNTPPTVIEDTIKKHINIWPFLIKTDSTIDLSKAAKDNEDDTLSYKVVSSTWSAEDYTIDDNKLTINSFKNFSKGSFEIQAYDSQGAFCSFNVKVTSTNIGILAMILMIVGIIILFTTLILIARKNRIVPFMGEITVSYPKNHVVQTSSKTRGQIKLSDFGIGETKFNAGAYFQATGQKYIYFISKKSSVYSTISVNETKKIKIDSGTPIRIYPDVDRTEYIEVIFRTYKD